MRNIVNILILIVIAIVVFYIAMIGIGFYLSPQDVLKPADAIVVISGGETRSRTITGIELYQDKIAPLIIFSGDAIDPYSPSNAEAMRDIAVEEFEIPSDNIVIEEEATSTFENATNLKVVFDRFDIHSIILVTSPYHQRRSKMTFQNVMGPEFTIINHSSTDEFWRKIAWYQNDKALYLTFAELWKIIYIYTTGEYQ
jgi:uncharacterized SAM-binding protein YcdF (DUF218 family)